MEEYEKELEGFSPEQRKTIIKHFCRLQRKLAKRGIIATIRAGVIIYTSNNGNSVRKEDVRNLLPNPSDED